MSVRTEAQAAVWEEIEDAIRERFAGRYEVHANPAVGTVTVILRPPGSEPRSGTPLVEIHNSTHHSCGSGPFPASAEVGITPPQPSNE